MGETSWSHTQLTPKAAKIYKLLAFGQVSPPQFPTPQLPGALPCLRKVNFRWLFPSPLFFIAQRWSRFLQQGKKGKMRSTQPSGLRGSHNA